MASEFCVDGPACGGGATSGGNSWMGFLQWAGNTYLQYRASDEAADLANRDLDLRFQQMFNSGNTNVAGMDINMWIMGGALVTAAVVAVSLTKRKR